MILYISGPISSDMDGYKSRFRKVESVLKLRGHIVLNPAVHPLGLPYEAYLKIDLAMVDVSDGIVMLHGWQNSNGARRELKHALRMGKKVFYGVENVPVGIEINKKHTETVGNCSLHERIIDWMVHHQENFLTGDKTKQPPRDLWGKIAAPHWYIVPDVLKTKVESLGGSYNAYVNWCISERHIIDHSDDNHRNRGIKMRLAGASPYCIDFHLPNIEVKI